MHGRAMYEEDASIRGMDPFRSVPVKREWETKMSNEIANTESLLIDEFEIIELEDRLELAGRCNIGCGGDGGSGGGSGGSGGDVPITVGVGE
jgi:hypothetical protein